MDLDWENMGPRDCILALIRIREVVAGLLGNCYPDKLMGHNIHHGKWHFIYRTPEGREYIVSEPYTYWPKGDM